MWIKDEMKWWTIGQPKQQSPFKQLWISCCSLLSFRELSLFLVQLCKLISLLSHKRLSYHFFTECQNRDSTKKFYSTSWTVFYLNTSTLPFATCYIVIWLFMLLLFLRSSFFRKKLFFWKQVLAFNYSTAINKWTWCPNQSNVDL